MFITPEQRALVALIAGVDSDGSATHQPALMDMCFRFVVEAPSQECIDEGGNVEIVLERRDATMVPEQAVGVAECEVASRDRAPRGDGT